MASDAHITPTGLSLHRQPVTMSSREIAELVNSRHDKVKQSVERLAERGVIGLPPLGEYLDSLGRKATEYRIGKRDSYVIVAQLSPEFTARLVDRWQELENQQTAAPALPDFANPVIAARAWADAVEARQLADAQDETEGALLSFSKALLSSLRMASERLGRSSCFFRQLSMAAT